MRNIEWIVAYLGVLVAVPTEALCGTHSYAQVLLVTANAVLNTHRLSGRGEFGLQKVFHRMPIVGIFVAPQTLFVARRLVDKVRLGI